MENLTLEKVPEAITLLFEQLQRINEKLNTLKPQIISDIPKYVDINGAAKILSKSPNAIRVQISLGNLKSIKKGSRNYFEVKYLENWLSGKDLSF